MMEVKELLVYKVYQVVRELLVYKVLLELKDLRETPGHLVVQHLSTFSIPKLVTLLRQRELCTSIASI